MHQLNSDVLEAGAGLQQLVELSLDLSMVGLGANATDVPNQGHGILGLGLGGSSGGSGAGGLGALGSGRGSGGSLTASGEQAQGHDQYQHECEILFHLDFLHF